MRPATILPPASSMSSAALHHLRTDDTAPALHPPKPQANPVVSSAPVYPHIERVQRLLDHPLDERSRRGLVFTWGVVVFALALLCAVAGGLR